ncbi:MAG: glycosyltransferase family 39 protein [Candidatus Sumerlaeaceae bacterium]
MPRRPKSRKDLRSGSLGGASSAGAHSSHLARSANPVPSPVWMRAFTRVAERRGAVLVAAVALVVRLAHWAFVRIYDPFYAHTLPETDMHTYWEWAKAIAAGDWLSRKQGAFYYGPLYPYWLALWFRFFGPNFDVVHGLQAAIGVVAPLAIWSLTRRLIGAREGLVAGLLIATAAPIIFYEQLLLMEGLLVAIHALFIWSVGRGLSDERRQAWHWAALSGLLAGLACLGRGNFQLVALLFLAVWYVAPRFCRSDTGGTCGSQAEASAHSPRAAGVFDGLRKLDQERLRAVAAYAATLGLVLGLSLARNGLVGDKWVLTTSNGPILLYLGNAPDSMGIFHYPDSFFAIDAKYGGDRGAVPWTRELLVAIAHQPLQFVKGLARKIALFLSAYEVADNANFYLLGRFSPLVRWNPFGWQLILSFGVLGLWLERRHWRDHFFLYAYAASFALSIVAVFVVGRYRLEFLLPMAVWAGAGMIHLLEALAQRRWRRAAALTAVAIALWIAFAPRWSPAIGLNTPPGIAGVRPIRPNDYTLLARAFLESNRLREAEETLAEGFAEHPWDQTLAKNLALMLEHRGELLRASDVLRRYLAFMANDIDMARELARLLARAGRLEESRGLLQQLMEIAPNDTRTRQLLEEVRARQGAQAQSSP